MVVVAVAVSVPVRRYYCVCLLCASANRWRGGRGGDDGCVADSSDGCGEVGWRRGVAGGLDGVNEPSFISLWTLYRRSTLPIPLPGPGYDPSALPSNWKCDALKTAFYLPSDNNYAYLYADVRVCVCPPPSVIVFIYFIYNIIIHYYYYVGRPYTTAPPFYSRQLHVYAQRKKRPNNILFVYDIMHIILCLYNGTNFYGNYTPVRINSTAYTLQNIL